MKQPDPWLVMATHVFHFEGAEGTVDVVQLTHPESEFYFHVHFADRELLLNRMAELPEVWSGSPLAFDEAKSLGESIEQQIGYRLPARACNNPFLYQGDLEVRIERFPLGSLVIERAKAPFSPDIFYRIVFSKEQYVTMVKRDISGERQWACEEADRTEENAFNLFKSMLAAF